MSILYGETGTKHRGQTTSSLTLVLTLIALSLWLVVIPLELTGLLGRGLGLA